MQWFQPPAYPPVSRTDGLWSSLPVILALSHGTVVGAWFSRDDDDDDTPYFSAEGGAEYGASTVVAWMPMPAHPGTITKKFNDEAFAKVLASYGISAETASASGGAGLVQAVALVRCDGGRLRQLQEAVAILKHACGIPQGTMSDLAKALERKS